jgi:hypothetical protein
MINRQTTMQRRSLRYTAYLIRLWEEGQPGEWRASAQHVQSGETVRFAEVAQLFVFLQAKLCNEAKSEPSATTGDAPAQCSPDNPFDPQ